MGKNENGEGQAYAAGPQPGQGAENGWQGPQAGQAGPQPGVMYQFVPGAGFVPVMCAPGQWGCPPYGYPGGYAGGYQQQDQQQPSGPQAGPQFGPQFGPQPGYGPGPQPGPYGNPYGAPYGAPYDHDAHESHHGYGPYGPQGPDMGQMYGMVGDVMKGKGDPGKLLGMLQAPGGEFWKGALVGAAAVMLFNSGAVKDALGGIFGAMAGQQEGSGCAPADSAKED